MDLCSEREPIGVARAACFEELAGVFPSPGALYYAKILASLNRKYFCYQHKTVSDRKSGNSLMDGDRSAAQNNRNRGVREEIMQFTDGR